ncbi:MAG: hypothetical protein IJI19_09725 [Ruminococcus sp.]|nr:hypothetical protein [Ruminococcus sp.]
MNNKKVKITIIVISIILFNLLVFFIIKNVPIFDEDYFITHPHYLCIAVDSQENIYIGSVGQIRVINNKGEIIRDIPIETSKGFVFNIIDDRLYIDIASGSYVADLTGKKLDMTLTDEENRRIQSRSTSCYYTKDGTKYYLNHNCVFRTKNGETEQIYPTPNQFGGHTSPTVGYDKEGII